MHNVEVKRQTGGFISYYHIGKSIRHVRGYNKQIMLYETRDEAFRAGTAALCRDLDKQETKPNKTAISHVFANFKGE